MIPHIPFGRTGHDSSRVIFGAAALGAMRQDRADRILDLLLQFGIDHIDSAASYGDSEPRVGAWMARHRDRFFLATKTAERSYAGAKASIEASRRRLDVDRIDLIQLHNLVNERDRQTAFAADGALAALCEARDAGHVRFIGVTVTARRSRAGTARASTASRSTACSCRTTSRCWRSPIRGGRRCVARGLSRAGRRGADDQGGRAPTMERRRAGQTLLVVRAAPRSRCCPARGASGPFAARALPQHDELRDATSRGPRSSGGADRTAQRLRDASRRRARGDGAALRGGRIGRDRNGAVLSALRRTSLSSLYDGAKRPRASFSTLLRARRGGSDGSPCRRRDRSQQGDRALDRPPARTRGDHRVHRRARRGARARGRGEARPKASTRDRYGSTSPTTRAWPPPHPSSSRTPAGSTFS